jgi:hypothetical protein
MTIETRILKFLGIVEILRWDNSNFSHFGYRPPIFGVANSDRPPDIGLMKGKTHSVMRVFQAFGISKRESSQANLKVFNFLRLEGRIALSQTPEFVKMVLPSKPEGVVSLPGSTPAL